MIRRAAQLRSVLFAVGATLTLIALPATRAASATPAGELEAAWLRVQRAGTYGFDARVEQRTTPRASVRNAGRQGRSQALQISGEVDLPADRMELRLWAQGGSVLDPDSALALRIEEGRSLLRTGEGRWEETEAFGRDLFAPGGDLLAYLAAAENVRRAPLEGADAAGELRSGTRYRFDLDGAAFAELLRRRSLEDLEARGSLPPGARPQLSAALEAMEGEGELWVSAEGLPLRQRLELRFPERPDAQEVGAQLDVSFRDIAPLSAGPLSGRLGSSLVLALRAAEPLRLAAGLGALLAALALLSVLLRHRRSRRAYGALALAVILSMGATPLLTASRVAAFQEETVARTQRAQEAREDAESQAEMQRALASPRVDPRQDPLAGALARRAAADEASDGAFSSEIAPFLFSICESDPHSDADGDGLSNLEECLVGTMPDVADSDGDLIDDGEEVAGRSLDVPGGGKRTWYLDPLVPDSNMDGISDFEEWSVGADLTTPYDSDADGTPDAWDRDNDGDGVPDKLDLSPYFGSPAATPFTGDQPFELIVDELSEQELVEVELQVRPTDPDHLWYTMNVFDWPEGDAQGQIQDADGKTFLDLDPSLDPAPNAEGDVRLVPMLQIDLPDGGASLPSADILKPLGISVQSPSEGLQRAYVPLTLISDPLGEENVAFHGRMMYRAQASWGQAHEVRLVWLVQALVDTCKTFDDGVCSAYEEGGMNESQVIHVYEDPFLLTGLNVSEELGAEIAVAYEDPAVSDDGPLYLDTLHGLLYGLDATFLSGARCPDAPESCVGSVDEIARRWDHESNAEVSDTERWGLADELSVLSQDYDVAELMIQDTVVTRTKQVLTDHFTDAWSAAAPITPTLLFAWEQRYRALSLDVGAADASNVQWAGRLLTLDLPKDGDSAVVAKTSRTLTWKPYAYQPGTGWTSADLMAYRDQLPAHLSGLTEGLDAEASAALLAWAQMLYTSASSGLSKVAYSGDRGGDDTFEQDDASLAAELTTASRALIRTVVNLYFSESEAINIILRGGVFIPGELAGDEGEFVAVSRLASSAELLSARYQALVKALGSKLAAASSVWLVLGLAATTVVTYVLSTYVYAGPTSEALRITAAVAVALLGLVFTVIKPVRDVLSFARHLGELLEDADMAVSRSEAIVEVLTTSSELLNHSRLAGVVGLVIAIGISIGIFIWAIASGQVSVGTIAFDELLAMTIATIIWAIVLFILALTVVGAILVGILTIVDLVLTLLGIPSVSQDVDEAIASVIYQFKMTVDTPDIAIGDIGLELGDPDAGMAAGNTIRYSMPITTTIQQQDADRGTVDDVDDNALAYALNRQLADTIDLTISKGGRRDDMYDVGVYDSYTEHYADGSSADYDLYEGSFTDTLRIQLELREGINAYVPFFLDTAYALIGVDCWVGVCTKERTVSGSTSSQVGSSIVLDVLPATLDDFVDGAWSDGGLRIADADGDGLLPASAGGADPDDGTWDADGDGLSDAYELELRSRTAAEGGRHLDPLSADTDGDGLRDGEELRWGTNPDHIDSDDDGLHDGEELAPDGGWDLPYAPTKTTRAYSSALSPDLDGDGLSDLFELTQDTCPDCTPWLDEDEPAVYHPGVPNRSPVPLYMQNDSLGGLVAPGASVVVTTTTSNHLGAHEAMVGSLRLELPEGYEGGPLSSDVSVASGESQSLVSSLTAPSASASSVLESRMDLTEYTDQLWTWDAAEGTSFTDTLGDVQGIVSVATPLWSQPFLVLGTEADDEGSYLRAYALSADGDVLDGATIASVGASEGSLGSPDVACAADGGCLVVWAQSGSDGTGVIRSAQLQGGVSSPSSTALFTNPSGKLVGAPFVASDGESYLVAFAARNDENKMRIWARPVDAGGSYAGDAQRFDGAISLSSGGVVGLAWGGEAYDDAYLTVISDGGMLTAARFSKAGAGSGRTVLESGRAASLAFDPLSQQALLSFVGGVLTDTELRALRLTATGASSPIVLDTEAETLWLSSTGVRTLAVADPENGGWIVSWSVPNTKGVRYRAVAADGSLRGDRGLADSPEGNPDHSMACERLAPSLALELDDPSGTMAFQDASGGGHSATCSDDSCPEAQANGRFGEGASFDGVNDWLKASVVQSVSEFATELWFQTSCQTCPLLHRENGHAYLSIAEGEVCARVLKTVPGGTAYDEICTSGANYADAAWTHVVHVGRGDRHELYVNGEKRASSGTIAPVDCPSGCRGVTIGADGGAFFQGDLDRIRFYPRALSSAEIDDVFRSPEVVLDLDQPAGALIFPDAAGNAFDATCQGDGCPEAGVDGEVYTALRFDGDDDELMITKDRPSFVYHYDFETGVDDAWSTSTTAPALRHAVPTRILGPFGNDTIELQLENLPVHDSIELSLDLFVLGAWDGNRTDAGPDRWTWKTDAETFEHTTFSNTADAAGNYQQFPSQYNILSGVTLYKDSNQDPSTTHQSFTSDADSLVGSTIGNDTTSAAVVYEDTATILYEDIHYGGSAWMIDPQRGVADRYDNDKVSSLRVWAARHKPKHGASGDPAVYGSLEGTIYELSETVSGETASEFGMSWTGSVSAPSSELWGLDNVELVLKGANVSVPLANKSFTLSAWARRESPGRADPILSQGSLHLGFDGSNHAVCGFDDDDLVSSATYRETDWHLWTCTFDAESRQRTIYRDGEQVAQDTADGVYASNGPTYVGSRHDVSVQHFLGSLDEIGIWTEVLSADEVAELFAKRKIDNESVAHCQMARSEDGAEIDFERLALRETTTRHGSLSQSVTRTLVVDDDDPVVSFSAPGPGAYVRAGDVIATGAASDPSSFVSRVEVKQNASGWQDAEGVETWSWDAGSLPNGVHTFFARATDAFGHVGASQSRQVLADGQAPAVDVSAGDGVLAPWRGSRGDWYVSLGGSASDPSVGSHPGSGVARIEVLLEGVDGAVGRGWQAATLEEGAWSLDYLLGRGRGRVRSPQGDVTVHLRAWDAVGNRATSAGDGFLHAGTDGGLIAAGWAAGPAGPAEQAALPSTQLHLDAQGPELSLASLEPGTELITQTLTLSGRVTDSLAVEAVELAFKPAQQVGALSDARLYLPLQDANAVEVFADLSGGGSPGICAEGRCPEPEDAGGVHGEAARFDGQDDSLAVAGVELAQGSFTVGAWAARDDAGRLDVLLSEGEPGTDQGFSLGFRDDDLFTCAFWGDDLLTDEAHTDSGWHHWACSYDADTRTRTLYLDGAQVAQDTSAGSFDGAGDLYVGSRLDADGSHFGGLINQVTVHDRALAAWEVQYLADHGQTSWLLASVQDGQWSYTLPEGPGGARGGLPGPRARTGRAGQSHGPRRASALAWRDRHAPAGPQLPRVHLLGLHVDEHELQLHRDGPEPGRAQRLRGPCARHDPRLLRRGADADLLG